MGRITKARLVIRELPDSLPIDSCTINTLSVGNQADLQCKWDTSQNTFPPWMLVWDTWEFTDAERNAYLTPFIEAEYADDTHPWKSLQDEHLKVYWYGVVDAVGERVLAAA